jgi:hypothetical protein
MSKRELQKHRNAAFDFECEVSSTHSLLQSQIRRRKEAGEVDVLEKAEQYMREQIDISREQRMYWVRLMIDLQYDEEAKQDVGCVRAINRLYAAIGRMYTPPLWMKSRLTGLLNFSSKILFTGLKIFRSMKQKQKTRSAQIDNEKRRAFILKHPPVKSKYANRSGFWRVYNHKNCTNIIIPNSKANFRVSSVSDFCFDSDLEFAGSVARFAAWKDVASKESLDEEFLKEYDALEKESETANTRNIILHAVEVSDQMTDDSDDYDTGNASISRMVGSVEVSEEQEIVSPGQRLQKIETQMYGSIDSTKTFLMERLRKIEKDLGIQNDDSSSILKRINFAEKELVKYLK